MITLWLRYGSRRVEIRLPEGWEEVSMDVRPQLASYLYAYPEDIATAHALAHYVPEPWLARFKKETMTELAHLMSWYTFVEQEQPILPYLEIDGQRWHLIADKFADGSAMEWPLADEYFGRALHTDDDTQHLDAVRHLAAVLYREHDQHGQRVPTSGRKDIAVRAERLRDCADIYGLQAFMHFARIKRDVAAMYSATLFKTSDPEDDQERSDDSAPFGWWGIYLDVAESGVFGTVEDVHRASFHHVCMHLSKRVMDAERMKTERLFHNQPAAHDH